MPPPSNLAIAAVLREIALFLQMDDVPFKPRAYEKAASAVARHDAPCADLYARGGPKALAGIPGVGASIAEKIAELVSTGTMAYHQELRARTPVDVTALTGVEGIGPKAARALYDALGVADLASLEAAARAGAIRSLAGFGPRSEEKILAGLALAKRHLGRFQLSEIRPLVEDVAARIGALAGVAHVTIAGSIRRRRETVGDADLLVVARRPKPVMTFVAGLPEVAAVLGHGDTKTSVRLDGGLQVDVRVVPRQSLGAALHYFTGSKAHNVRLRQLAMKRTLKLNEYGVFRGRRAVAGRTEADVYEALGLPYIPPELREDRGEIEAAAAGTLPRLIEHDALRGDLQTQTDWTDGADGIEAMVAAARRLGREYLAITDHTRDLAMTGGCDEAKLARQGEAIDALDRRLRGFRVLKGAEVNIRRDGTLDVDDAALARLDVVGAAVHSHFDLPRREMTARVVRAIRNPHVDVLFHPTARVLGRREPIDLDVDAVIAAARETGTVLELDALPSRLDLRDDHVRKAVAAGVKVAIDSDAHAVAQLGYPEAYGIDQARRGWATAGDVVNTLPVDALLAALKDGMRAADRGLTPPARSRRAARSSPRPPRARPSRRRSARAPSRRR